MPYDGWRSKTVNGPGVPTVYHRSHAGVPRPAATTAASLLIPLSGIGRLRKLPSYASAHEARFATDARDPLTRRTAEPHFHR